MNTFKRKALFTAVVAGFGTIGTAEAVFIAPNGTGQALLYPYYTVQNSGTNGWNTYLSIVNTTSDAKAVKVRVLEGRTSAEVLDFNLFLSANDVWTAAIVPVDATDSSGGKIITADVSCTAPAIGASGEPFRNFQYVAQAAGLGRGLDRTREGYVEMIEMASLSGTAAAAVTHTAAGVPLNCAYVRVASYAAINGGGSEVFPPTGGLMGTGTLINVNNGLDAGYKADALEAYNTVGLITATGATVPALADVFPAVGIVFNSGFDILSSSNLTVYQADFTAGAAPTDGAMALASVYMHDSIMNEYVLDNATASRTDWVVTQPIKNFFVDATTAWAPYTQKLTASGACEEVEFSYFNREERGATAGGIDFSPPPPAGPSSAICWESNILSIRNGATHMPTTDVSGVLGSRNSTSINITDTFQNGWAQLRFTDANASGVGLTSVGGTSGFSFQMGPLTPGSAAPYTFFGLPATGFMVRTFSNGTLTCGTASCQGNYASLFNHSYRNVILP
jgi:hypothetical protein